MGSGNRGPVPSVDDTYRPQVPLGDSSFLETRDCSGVHDEVGGGDGEVDRYSTRHILYLCPLLSGHGEEGGTFL